MLRSTVCSIAVASALLAPAAAHADVVVLGTGEPEFTNSANNTQWVQWTNSGPYRVEFNHSACGLEGLAAAGIVQKGAQSSSLVVTSDQHRRRR